MTVTASRGGDFGWRMHRCQLVDQAFWLRREPQALKPVSSHSWDEESPERSNTGVVDRLRTGLLRFKIPKVSPSNTGNLCNGEKVPDHYRSAAVPEVGLG